MTDERTLPYTGLQTEWRLGSSGWKPGHDANWRKLDMLVHLAVISATRSDPPSLAANGDRYIIPASANGAWSGHTDEVAYYDAVAAQWFFYPPKKGWRCRNFATNVDMIWNGTSWVNVVQQTTTGGGTGGGGVTNITNVISADSTYSVKAMGAKGQYNISTGTNGDGTPRTNDAPAIQMALNAARDAGGGTVTVPTGVYFLATTLHTYNNVSLRGAGEHAHSTIFYREGNYGDTLVCGVDNVGSYGSGGAGDFNVEDIWFWHGPSPTNSNTSINNVTAGTAHLRVYGGQMVFINRCWFWRLSHGVVFHNSVNMTVDDCWFSGFYDPSGATKDKESIAAIFFAIHGNGHNQMATIRNNYITGYFSPNRNVTWYDGTGGSATLNDFGQNNGSLYGILIHALEEFYISHNRIGGQSGACVYISPQNVTGVPTGGFTADGRICNNFFDGWGTEQVGAGIQVTSAASQTVLALIIEGNTFNGETCSINAINIAANPDYGVTNVVIANNTIFATVGSAIINAGSRGTVITGNTISNYNCRGVAGPSGSKGWNTGIFCTGSAAFTMVSGNAIGGGGNAIVNDGSNHCQYLYAFEGTYNYSHVAFGNLDMGQVTSPGYWQVNNHLVPTLDNAFTLGGSALRYALIYCANGTILTSDPEAKLDIEAVPPDMLELLMKMEPKTFRMAVGGNTLSADGKLLPREGRRTHWGFLADNIRDVMAESGRDFGGYVASPDGDGLRYDQILTVAIAATQELTGLVRKLEAKITKLEGKPKKLH